MLVAISFCKTENQADIYQYYLDLNNTNQFMLIMQLIAFLDSKMNKLKQPIQKEVFTKKNEKQDHKKNCNQINKISNNNMRLQVEIPKCIKIQDKKRQQIKQQQAQKQRQTISYMKTIKNKSEYEIYEDELNQYNNRNKSKVIGKPQQWNLIQSRLINAKNHKAPKQQRIVIDADRDSAESRAISRKGVSNDKIGSQSPNLYNQQYVVQIQKTPASSKSPQQLQSQIKNMRQMLINLNNEVNSKLNKYELHQYVPKGMAIVNDPEKQEALLMAQIQTNAKVIQALQKEIKEIKQRDRELEEKDYLIDLQIAAGEIMRNIRGTRKQKHNGKVIVQKLDGRLLQLQEQSLQNQFRAVKHLKHNILHYFKKQIHQSQTLQQLSIQQSQLQQKLNKLQQKYKKLVTLAQQQNMPVKVNINYIQNKKIYDDKMKKVDFAKKNIDVVKKAKDIQCVKIKIECDRIKKDIGDVDGRIQNFCFLEQRVSQNMEQDLGKSRRGNMLAKMIQKFGEATSQSPQKQRNILQSLPMIPSPNRYQTASYRPQYNTIDIQRSLRIKNRSKRKLEQQNDKNSRSIRFEDDESRMVKQYRIKPSLHSKKKSEGNKFSQGKGNADNLKKGNEDIVEDLLLAEGDQK